MALIDRLIHQYHWGLRHPERGTGPRGPTRPTGVNFIEGNVRTVLGFLDALGELGEPADTARARARVEFRENRELSRPIWGLDSGT